MGYVTDFSGTVLFRGLKDRDLKSFKDVFRNHGLGISSEFKVEVNENGIRLHVWAGWKNRHDKIERLMRALVKAYPGISEGRIDACGEEREDVWALEIRNGTVKRIHFEWVRAGEEVLFDACLEPQGGNAKC